jgi:hypothetical protein
MTNSISKQLAPTRIEEMDRWGRDEIYSEMRSLLDEDRAIALDLINHGLTAVDDELDSSDSPLPRLYHYEELFTRAYSGIPLETETKTEETIVELGQRLSELDSIDQTAKQSLGMITYHQVLAFWQAEKRNLDRRWGLLSQNSLDHLATDIGSTVALQFLYILDPSLNSTKFEIIGGVYGLAVKLADNLCDFKADIHQGFINIPEESIHHVSGITIINNRVTQVNPEDLLLSRVYLEQEYSRVEENFDKATELLANEMLARPHWDCHTAKKLGLFVKFCESWLEQSKEFIATKTK